MEIDHNFISTFKTYMLDDIDMLFLFAVCFWTAWYW